MNDQIHPILWIHADCLNPYGPAFAAYPGAPAVFVFDDALLADWQISLKRLTFIYECLLELPVTIRRGVVASEVLAFAHEHAATKIITTQSPSPRFRTIRAEMQRQLPIETLLVVPFVSYAGTFDLQRFSRYWRIAQRYAFGQQPMFD